MTAHTKTGLFIGRFQPLHNAHLKDIKDALREVDVLTIGIGSSNKQRTAENPFSAQERRKMIEAALGEEGLGPVQIVEIPDFNDDKKWMEHISTIMPRPDVVFMGNQATQKFFEQRGYTVKKLPFVEGISGTIVREMMCTGKKWESLVPKPVADYIQKANLMRHLR